MDVRHTNPSCYDQCPFGSSPVEFAVELPQHRRTVRDSHSSSLHGSIHERHTWPPNHPLCGADHSHSSQDKFSTFFQCFILSIYYYPLFSRIRGGEGRTAAIWREMRGGGQCVLIRARLKQQHRHQYDDTQG
jgi:hypothetical protein